MSDEAAFEPEVLPELDPGLMAQLRPVVRGLVAEGCDHSTIRSRVIGATVAQCQLLALNEFDAETSVAQMQRALDRILSTYREEG